MSVKVRYVGKQPRKRANTVIASSQVVWNGHGDVQLVTDQEAAVLLQQQYDKIWQKVEDAPAPAPVPLAAAAPPTQEAQPVQTEEDEDDAGDAAPVTADQVRARITEILTVIPELTTADFDDKGQPKLSSLKAKLGRPVTRAERDAAWKTVQAHAQTSDAAAQSGSSDVPE